MQYSLMSSLDERFSVSDVAHAAAIIASVVETVPERELQSVPIPNGTADVILDDAGADVVLPGGVTVHVRTR